ncbi:MAE_28990/MAE_18760 family HEPN-like nuclease [Pseudonocardia sp. Ae717_Ps2]|uniref:MAE_28990/MAE_18760 family HEPN-like nuclease n=1 Tax=Pseudonocardia sp. Ae717_Ps2 TaxID=1885573 RepID=UPI00117BBF43|nr:MAE_28990/MAE_18760 family HEPN-like nuclease [Pseudonocardia sp. Ae717_Ps2]
MKLLDLRAELENDLSWRLDELRHLRNLLLPTADQESWPVSSMRTLLVMQYAHLEGYVRNSANIYVAFINSIQAAASDVRAELVAAALLQEFEAVRKGGGVEAQEDGDENGVLLKRAKSQVAFVNKIRMILENPVEIDSGSAVSLDMNLSADVLRRQLFVLGIPSERVERAQFSALEFVRRTRHDIAHGNRKERISTGEFQAHTSQSERFMSDLARLITSAARDGWYRSGDGA